MASSTAHNQSRGLNGRGFAPADPVIADLADLNEEGTARHLDFARILRLLERVDEELDLVAAERHRVIIHLNRLHERERKANEAFDALRVEFRRLNEEALRDHRLAGQVCCDAQAQRRAPKVHVEGTIHRLEVR